MHVPSLDQWWLRVALAATWLVTGAQAQTRLWSARFDGGLAVDPPGASTTRNDLAVDAQGSVYVTGSASNGLDDDCLTARYDATGQLAWSARLTGSGYDLCWALAIDAQGNTYVAGGRPLGDAFIVKYDAAGTQQWRRDFAGAAGLSDYARGLVVDAGGDLYVTGYSMTRMSDEGEIDADAFTLKYDAAGQRLWARTWGLVGGDERFDVLVLDGAGNPIVSGAGGHVIAYAALDGAERWHAQPTLLSTTRALAATGDGGVLATGPGWDGADRSVRTVKLGASGIEQWARTYGGGSGNFNNSGERVRVDALGQVYVAGHLHEAAAVDMLLLKYAADGTPLWARTFDSPAGGQDFAYDMVLDAAGRVYVAGSSATTSGANEPTDRRVLIYDGDGTLLRVMVDDGGSVERVLALAARPSGGVVAHGTSVDTDGDLRTTAYDADGSRAWVVEEPTFSETPDRAASGENDVGRHCAAVGADGRVYVTGSTRALNDDLLTLAYAPDGSLLWSRRLDQSGADDRGHALGLDNAGNVYVAGTSNDSVLLAKYAPDGSLTWSRAFRAAADTSDAAFALAVDPAGGAALTGWSRTAAFAYRALTLRYDGAGTLLWARIHGGSAQAINALIAVGLDAAGNVYAAGTRSGGAQPSAGLLLKYAPDGTLAWQREHQLGPSLHVRIRALAVHPDGRSALAGSVNGDGSALVAVYDASGGLLWERRRGGPAESRFNAATFASDGKLVLAGGLGGDFDVVAYQPDGTLAWAAPPGTQGLAYAVAVDAGGGLYASGRIGYDGAPTTDFRTLHIDAAGALVWRDDYDGPTSGPDVANAVAIAPNGDALAAGTSWGQNHDVVTLRYKSPGADLAVGLVDLHGGSPLAQGEAFDTLVNVQNAGPLPSDVSAGYSLPSGSTLLAVTGRGWTCGAPLAQTLTCGFSALPSGGQAAFTVRATAPQQGGVASSAVSISGSLSDPRLDDNAARLDRPVAPADGAAVTISNSRASSVPGEGSTYVVALMNASAQAAQLPVHVTLAPAQSDASWSCTASAGSTCAPGTGPLADTPTVAAHGFVLYELSADIDPGAAGLLVTSADVLPPAGFPDPDPADNHGSDSDALTPRTDLALSLAGTPDPVAIQGTLAYALTIANAGPSRASGATLRHDLPPGFALLSAPAGCDASGTTTACALPDIAPGASAGLVLAARPGPGTLGSATATAHVSPAPSASDPQPANDDARATTQVTFVKGDFDHTSSSDLLLRRSTSGELVAWLMNGVERVALAPLEPALAPEWLPQAVDDFDADGHNDVLVRHAVTGEVRFVRLLGTTGAGTWPLVGAPTLAANWKLSASADFDHDGRPDLVWRNVVSQNIVVWTLSAGVKTGTLLPTPGQAVDGNWEIVAARDYDGDGNTDLLWYNRSSGRIVQWLMDAQLRRLLGRFTTPMGAGDANWKVLASGDYGIGPGGQPNTADLVWRNATSGRYVVWHLDHTGLRTAGVFVDPPAPETQPLDWEIVGPR